MVRLPSTYLLDVFCSFVVIYVFEDNNINGITSSVLFNYLNIRTGTFTHIVMTSLNTMPSLLHGRQVAID